MSKTTAELETYEVTVNRTVEMDIGKPMAETLQNQYDADSIETALARSVAEIEASGVEAREKLTNLDVEVNGPSDD